MNPLQQSTSPTSTRRTFVQALAAGAGLAAISHLSSCDSKSPETTPTTKPTATPGTTPTSQPTTTPVAAPPVIDNVEPINVAIIGVGKQGKILLDNMLKIPGVRVNAICDIWSYGRILGEGQLRSAKQHARIYEDYREMLAESRDVEAVFVATPDFSHASITNDCLRAGKHVYCEKEMSNTLEGAASMVLTARQTGRLLQIGHQRRSSPFYRHAHELIKGGFCGTIYTINGQWNQFKELRPLPPKMVGKYPMSESLLHKWGYCSYAEFYEWRWFNKYAGGPMSDLGSHQIDVYNWFLGSMPTRVTAIGGRERAVAEAEKAQVGFVPECFDRTMCLYEWDLKDRTVVGHYQVSLNTSNGGFYECFEGTGGTIVTAETREKISMVREPTGVKLEWVDEAEILAEAAGKPAGTFVFDPLASRRAKGKLKQEDLANLENELTIAAQWPHLVHIRNFINAIHKKEALSCPAADAYACAVCVLKANEAAMTGKRIEFKPEDFKV